VNSNQAFKSWKERIEKGDRNIALSNVGHVASQQKYLLAILSHLSADPIYKNKKIGLVSFDLRIGLYNDYRNDYFPNDDRSLFVPNKLGSHFINWNILIARNIPIEFINDYDLLLWDLPDLNFININSHSLERFFSEFDSMLIVSLRPNGIGEADYIKRIHNFYNNHGLKLPNNMINPTRSTVKSEKMSDLIRRLIGF